ncbi:hypothetical protein Goari_027102 [Gossypium aridum]|uniref:Uncharacterized protein n=1 Tax=Gossypium aridum TaxID=34290 RepID=A0A7J8YQF7_GOSAI|nr:hypothetical protein [Gossypium aridum]
MAPSALPNFSSSFLFPLKTQKSFKPPKPLTIICSSQEPKKPSKNPQRPTSRNRKRTPYGTSRRSILKKTFTQEQVKFTAGVSADPHVGIIGGGMAGLLCALSLEKRGVNSTVFDTVGSFGYLSECMVWEEEWELESLILNNLHFDHAAQFFSVSDSRFSKLVDYWLEKGFIREWQGLVGQLELGGRFVPLPSSPPRFIGTSMVNVVRPCWISKLEPFNGMWHLSENGKPRGEFDAIVIAHNGNIVPQNVFFFCPIFFNSNLLRSVMLRFLCQDLDRADHADKPRDNK